MGRKSKRAAEWEEARRVCRLDAETIRMAMELGMMPRSLMKNRPNLSEPWKAPVREWVRGLHAKRFGRHAKSTLAPRVPGGAKGQIWMSEDFDAELPADLLQEFYGREGQFF
jgi:hypothetical protein